MKRGGTITASIILLTAILLFEGNPMLNAMGYDSTYVLACKQKAAIPENVNNGDYVLNWTKTYSWNSVGSITYLIEKNFNNAFSINSSTGLITISDATRINGKILQQDTIINLIIRTTDSEFINEYELDTAQIRVKENSYCKFFDYAGEGSGTRSNPYNSLKDVDFQTGYGYFLKRGSVINRANAQLTALIASEAHPTIIGAYGTGKKPKFVGSGIETSECWYVGSSSNPETGRCEYVYFYDIVVRNYGTAAYKTWRVSNNIGWYNCENYNNSIVSGYSAVIVNDQTYADSITPMPFEFINYYSDTAAGSHIKATVGPVRITNGYFIGGLTGVRFSAGNDSYLKHAYIKLIEGSSSNCGIQVRGDRIVIEDVILLYSPGDGIDITSPGHVSFTDPFDHMPDNCVIRNVLVRNVSGYGIGLWKPDAYNKVPYGNVIEDCVIDNPGTRGIRVNSYSNFTICRTVIKSAGNYGIYTGGNSYPMSDLNMQYNIIYGSELQDVYCTEGAGYFIYNNIVDGKISFSGSENAIARNNYSKATTGAAITSNYVDITAEIAATHFQDYEKHDYRIISTADKAIDQGYPVDLKYDYLGYAIQGAPDIGAYELIDLDSYIPPVTIPDEPPGTIPDNTPETIPDNTPANYVNNLPVISKQQFTVEESTFLNNYIGKINAHDDDAGQKLNYSIISGNASGLFKVNSQTGDLTTISSKIFGVGTYTHELVIEVTDDAIESKSASANITVKLIGKSTIVYINPDNTNDLMANGSIDHPYDSWDDVTWKEGCTYLQKRGTETTTNKILIGASKVTLGAYGEGESPVISSETNTYLVSGFEKSGIKIRDLDLQATNAVSCIYFLGNSGDSIVIEHCTLKANANAIKVVDGSTLVTKYNTITSNHEGIYSTAVSNEIYYNIFKSCNTAVNVVSNSSKANIYNNVFFDNEKSLSVSYAELTLYNNIFYMTTPGQMALSHGTGNIESDHNIFYPEQAGFITIANAEFDNLDELQKSLKIDMNSFNADPLFVDIYNENFSLGEGSPAINAGIDMNLGIDFLGSTVPLAGGADIGINEFTGPIIPSKKPKEESVMTIYPNPSSGQISILAEIKQDMLPDDPGINQPQIQVMDISGNTVFSELLENQNTSTIQGNIDLSGISNGLYFVVLHIADKVLKEKLIITR